MTSASIESPVATRDEWSPIGRSHIVDTATFVFWIALAATLYSGLQLFNKIQEIPTLQVQPANGWLALVLWSAYTAVFFAVLIRVQLFVRRSPWVIVGAFLWGGVTATYFAAQANAAFEDTLKVWLGPTADDRWITAVSAATNEETLKTLGIVVLVLLPLVRVRSTLDGWFYGTIIGLGFQVVEDFVYTIQESGNLTDVSVFLVQRGFFAGLWAHAIYSGIAGAGIGYLATRRDRSLGARIGVGVGLFVVAWLLHFVWDAPLLEDSLGNSRAAFFATILIKGVPALAILLWVVHVARKAERVRWSAFVQEHVDPTILPPDDAKALLDHRSRRAARIAAGRAGGARAKRVCAEIQTAELRYVQAVSEEGAESPSARRWAEKITALRREPVSSGTA